MDNPVLQVDNITFRYAGDPVLLETGFAVNKGDFAAIIGSNGAGKSTLMRLVLDELAPQGGEIRLFGTPVNRFKEWRRVGYVPQSSSVLASGFPANALEVVTASLYGSIGRFRLPGASHKRQALEALAAVGMAPFARRMIGQLSGGQLQRVMLARALVAGPDLLLLDEPSAGVDAASADHMYNLLREWNGRGMTIVMITHDTHRVAPYLNKAFCLEHGTLVELDQSQLAHELAHRHQHP